MALWGIDVLRISPARAEHASLNCAHVSVAHFDRSLSMASAASAVVQTMAVLAARRSHIVADLLATSDDRFVEWEHYPAEDARDAASGSRYFYHTHTGRGRLASEHGHFHLFLDRARVERYGPPEKDERDDNPETADLVHLVAIAMNAFGQPIALFTTNRWVTNETWYPAADIIAALDHFAMRSVGTAVNRWMTGMIQLYRPHIEALLHERDRAVLAWARRHGDSFVLEDRRLEVTSIVPVSLTEHVLALARRTEMQAPTAG
jgi:hypothetical protein